MLVVAHRSERNLRQDVVILGSGECGVQKHNVILCTNKSYLFIKGSLSRANENQNLTTYDRSTKDLTFSVTPLSLYIQNQGGCLQSRKEAQGCPVSDSRAPPGSLRPCFSGGFQAGALFTSTVTRSDRGPLRI